MWLEIRSRQHPKLKRIFQVRMSNPETAKTYKENGVEIVMQQGFMDRQKTIPPERGPEQQRADSSHFLTQLPFQALWECHDIFALLTVRT